jgi:hypothetical protein
MPGHTRALEIIEPTAWAGRRPLVQLRLHAVYSGLGLGEVGPQCAGIHQRPPPCAALLRTHWTPSPGGRLSRPQTTRVLRPTSAASADDEPSRRADEACPVEGPPGWFPRSLPTVRRGRRPAMPLRHRHGYAADLHRGLLASDIDRPRSCPHDRASTRRCPAPIHQV